ncbi:MAG TPA: hypothetical protein VEV17_19615 [Bryobacteraceae bacterium]|nr:hypothetical protein [Bryobacteraceae bacterium]
MTILVRSLVFAFAASLAATAQDLSIRAWQMESKGDASGAREFLERSTQGGGLDALVAYAQFLDRHHDPGARPAYERVLRTAQGAQRMQPARRLVELDLLAGDRDAAQRHLEQYTSAGGRDFSLPPLLPASAEKKTTISIPGPLHSFARMAALAPDLAAEDLLPALARNVVTNGYQAASGNEALEQTEYLKLVVRYLSQARELEKLAGADQVLKIESCDSAQTGELLRVLGYRMRGGCGSEVVLETVNGTRAFLTIDSGFPLAELEQSLRTNRPFNYDFKPTQVPVLYTADYWLSAKERQGGEFIDTFLGDPSLCRLYLAMAKLDPAAADELRKNTTLQRIRAYAHVLDFYGGMFQIRNGKAVVPGGARSEKAWSDLVGVAPDKPAAFFERLVAKDDGWMASYFDALSRISFNPANGPVQNYLTEPERMKRFYAAIRGKVTSPGPARPVFRSNTDMLLLTTRLRLDPDGRPHIPGNLEVWRTLFIEHPPGAGKYDAKLSKAAPAWKDPDDVLEALFGLCRKSVENEPLKIFMALSDMDRRRRTPLEAKTVDRLSRHFRAFGAQYPILAEAPELSDATVIQFLDVAEAINQIRDIGVRADAAGSMQALVGLWQIFYRQGSIAPADADHTLSTLLSPFAKLKNERDIFESGREGVKTLLAATKSPAGASPQDRMIDLLAGTSESDNSDAHTQLVEDMIRIFESQRLISLATIFELVDHLESIAKGEKANMALVNRMASRISEIQLPRTALSTVERNTLSFGYWSEKHIEAQRKLNLRALIDRAATDPKKLDDVRALMGPFLRDTLVGLNYVHYAPPGAQVLYTNPLFVRSHDFIGLQGSLQTWRPTEVLGTGWPTSAGGKLVGSLASLPYALAEAEQNFLIPSREQALIWGDLVPQLILSATVPRWWDVTPGQLHWVGLHMIYGEALLAESALNADRRQAALEVLSRYAMPARVEKIRELLEQGRVQGALENVMPSELFAIARDLLSDRNSADTPVAAEIHREAAEAPQHLNYQTISHFFGTPKPTLANSYSPELLNLRTFPTLMGYSSRILAESWESNLLYYGALADQLYLSPAQLNVLVPEWTRSTVERIFATHLEDWPALLRSLRLVGDDAREKAHRQATAAGAGL